MQSNQHETLPLERGGIAPPLRPVAPIDLPPPRSDPFRTESACLSDVGLVREANEDSCGVYPRSGLFLVADGLGGAKGGRQASTMAVETFERFFSADQNATAADRSLTFRLQEAAREANRRIFDRSRKDAALEGMGTTLVALLFEGQSRASLVNVGDSRAYCLRQGALRQLTVDHSVVAELVDRGEITAAEARVDRRRHVLTRALGIDAEVAVDVTVFDAHPGDVYLLCSDGIHDLIEHEHLKGLLVEHENDPGAACRALVAAANRAGGRDNATAVVVRCVREEPTQHARQGPLTARTLLPTGTHVGGRYEIVDVIGVGGMGVVYKVRERVGDVTRLRALKTVRAEYATPEILARFRQEAEKMCMLDHENIVPLIAYSDDGKMPFLVMPFIEGQTLQEYLKAHVRRTGRGLPLGEVMEIGLELVRGLDFAHHFEDSETGRLHAMVHRDIKPANIMIKDETRHGRPHRKVLIMDFGIAKALIENANASRNSNSMTSVIGTVKYASPEQLLRSKDVDGRTDLYSLGMVLYELYCGRHMLDGVSEHAVLMRVLRPKLEDLSPKFPPGTPELFRSLIERCVAVDRDERLPSVAAMEPILRQILTAERAEGTQQMSRS